jgi:hypothetical protein
MLADEGDQPVAVVVEFAQVVGGGLGPGFAARQVVLLGQGRRQFGATRRRVRVPQRQIGAQEEHAVALLDVAQQSVGDQAGWLGVRFHFHQGLLF